MAVVGAVTSEFTGVFLLLVPSVVCYCRCRRGHGCGSCVYGMFCTPLMQHVSLMIAVFSSRPPSLGIAVCGNRATCACVAGTFRWRQALEHSKPTLTNINLEVQPRDLVRGVKCVLCFFLIVLC